MKRDPEVTKAAHVIGRHLLPRDKVQSEEFWRAHWPVLKQLASLGAVLGERRHFFKKTRSRNNAWLLITTTDLVWQSIRAVSGKTGPDRMWLDRYLPPNHRDMFSKGSSLSFEPLEKVVDDINWVYALHSYFRHPGSNAQHLEMMLYDPWPEDVAHRLDVAAEAADGVLDIFESAFGLGNGWEDEVESKARLAAIADEHWSQRSGQPR